VETSSLWHYMFRSLVRVSIQGWLGSINIWYIQRILILNCNYWDLRSFPCSLVRVYEKYLSAKCSDDKVQSQQEQSYNVDMWAVVFLPWGTLLASGETRLEPTHPLERWILQRAAPSGYRSKLRPKFRPNHPPPTHPHTHTHTLLPVQYYHYFRYKVQMPL
jgi:hypothetical protein